MKAFRLSYTVPLQGVYTYGIFVVRSYLLM